MEDLTTELVSWRIGRLLNFAEFVLNDAVNPSEGGFFGREYGTVNAPGEAPPVPPAVALSAEHQRVLEVVRALNQHAQPFATASPDIVVWNGIAAPSAHHVAVRFLQRFFSVVNQASSGNELKTGYAFEFNSFTLLNQARILENLESVRDRLKQSFVEVTSLEFDILRARLQVELAVLQKAGEALQASFRLTQMMRAGAENETLEIARRPAYRRDHLWLDWYLKEKMGFAKIRDRWNAMSDRERQAACLQKWERVGGGTSQGKKAGYAIVKAAVAKARKERSKGEE